MRKKKYISTNPPHWEQTRSGNGDNQGKIESLAGSVTSTINAYCEQIVEQRIKEEYGKLIKQVNLYRNILLEHGLLPETEEHDENTLCYTEKHTTPTCPYGVMLPFNREGNKTSFLVNLRGDFISDSTTDETFFPIISGQKVKEKVQWIEDLQYLAYLFRRIKKILKGKEWLHKGYNIWQHVAGCFVDKHGNPITPDQLRKAHMPKHIPQILRNIIYELEDRLVSVPSN